MIALRCCLVSVLVCLVKGHDWGTGRCPTVEPMINMNVDKFLGQWYVIEQFDTTSSCMTLNYSRVSETQLHITKTRELNVLSEVGLGHNTYGGTLDIPYENLGKFRVKWPLNLAGKADYIVYDTDYSTYAGVFDCQAITTLMHRKSAAILSRTPTLDQQIINNLKATLQSFRISLRHFDKVKQEGCTPVSPSDVTIHVDSNTFTTLVNNARDGITGATDVLVDGIRTLGSTVASHLPSTDSTRGVTTVSSNNNNKRGTEPTNPANQEPHIPHDTSTTTVASNSGINYPDNVPRTRIGNDSPAAPHITANPAADQSTVAPGTAEDAFTGAEDEFASSAPGSATPTQAPSHATPLPADTTRPVTPSTTTRPVTPPATTRSVTPSTTTRPVTPSTTTRPVKPSTTTRPVTPSTTVQPNPSANDIIPVNDILRTVVDSSK